MSKEPELPKRLKFENAFLATATFALVGTLPIFIYNCSKSARKSSFVSPVLFSIYNPLNGTSCANIVANALWQYGIPTHDSTLQYEMRYGSVGLSYGFFVPSTQSFFADVLIRQWSRRLDYIVEHKALSKDGICSSRYSTKLYHPIGVMAKNKSLDMMVGNFLFGAWARIERPKKPKSKRKNN